MQPSLSSAASTVITFMAFGRLNSPRRRLVIKEMTRDLLVRQHEELLWVKNMESELLVVKTQLQTNLWPRITHGINAVVFSNAIELQRRNNFNDGVTLTNSDIRGIHSTTFLLLFYPAYLFLRDSQISREISAPAHSVFGDEFEISIAIRLARTLQVSARALQRPMGQLIFEREHTEKKRSGIRGTFVISTGVSIFGRGGTVRRIRNFG